MSDSNTPVPSSSTPPPVPLPPMNATQPTVPYPPQAQPPVAQVFDAASTPMQAYPGAVPSYTPPPAAPGPAPAPQPTYGSAPQQPGYALHNGTYAPAPRPTSGLALTSLICGVTGAALFWLFVTMLASIVAVITGHLALRQIKANPALGGRGMAIAGLIMGYIMVAFMLFSAAVTLFSVLFFGAFTLPFIFSV